MDEHEEVDEKYALPYELPSFHKWDQYAKFYHPLMAGSIDGTDMVAHDRAVIRAHKAKYTPNIKISGDPRKTLMIRRLSHETNEAALIRVFSQFGDIKKCRVVRDVISGRSRGYAFIEFYHESDTRSALRGNKDTVIDDCKIVVDSECERTLPGWIPRRFGGGFGGRKESGQLRFGGIERPFRRPLPLNSKPLGSKHEIDSSFDNKKRHLDDRHRPSNDSKQNRNKRSRR